MASRPHHWVLGFWLLITQALLGQGPNEWAPGLVTRYQSVQESASGLDSPVVRIEPKPALLFVPNDIQSESVYPELRPGPFRTTWAGWIDLRDSGPIQWGAKVCGTVRVEVDGKVVLEGTGRQLDSWVAGERAHDLGVGLKRLHVTLDPLPGTPGVRLQLGWEGTQFARELVPPWRFQHARADEPKELEQQRIVDRGRELAREMGCASCHRDRFPEMTPAPIGPSLHDAGKRMTLETLARWIADPQGHGTSRRMPRLCDVTDNGRAEAWSVAEYVASISGGKPDAATPVPDHRPGRNRFLGIGCTACHLVPDVDPGEQNSTVKRSRLEGLAERFSVEALTDFLMNPGVRYPDGRMPGLGMTKSEAREVAAYLLTFAGAGTAVRREVAADPGTLGEVARRRAGGNIVAAGRQLMAEKGCAQCHAGLGQSPEVSIPIRTLDAGCMSAGAGPRFHFTETERQSLAALLARPVLANRGTGRSDRQWKFDRAGCARCHARDHEGKSPLEEISGGLWTSHIARLPYLRTPPLTHALEKYTRDHVLRAVRDGVSGVRPSWYSYRMPHYGSHSEDLVRALAEQDGEWLEAPGEQVREAREELVSAGLVLTGFEGYSCVACHLWKGRSFTEPDPAAVGPDLASVARRIRRGWFDRWLEDPQRYHPGTPMPSFFPRGGTPGQREILGGDAVLQRDALWSYFARSDNAPNPEPRASEPIEPPPGKLGVMVGQIPLEVPGRGWVESLVLWSASRDLVVIDLGSGMIVQAGSGATLLRNPNGNRSHSVVATTLNTFTNGRAALVVGDVREEATAVIFRGFERTDGKVAARFRYRFPHGEIDLTHRIQLPVDEVDRRVTVTVEVSGLEPNVRFGFPKLPLTETWHAPSVNPAAQSGILWFDHPGVGGMMWDQPRVRPVEVKHAGRAGEWVPSGDRVGTPREWVRPGYRAVRFPMPKTASGEDLLMPGAVAVDRRTDRLYVASIKRGEIFTLDEASDLDPAKARFRDWAGGLFQDALSMFHDGRALRVLHRRNLTRIEDGDGDGIPDRFEREVALPHSIPNAYDWGYGLVREPAGTYIASFAPHANQRMVGSGAAVRLTPGDGEGRIEEVAWGYRNPVGWSAGPDGGVFYTDNQGEWVATSKVGHLVPGSYNGYPNPAQLQRTNHVRAPATVWVPYDWARSINGITWDDSGGKFGPFAGQLILAELMNGGALVRANVEQVNGVYQGACFPFWGQGLLGPLVLSFDSRGRLYVGSLTMPGWMGQPDRGAVFRIEFNGEIPFEMQSIHVRPGGFRVRMTRPASIESLSTHASWRVERYRYEYTGAYGSPELDRTPVEILQAKAEGDGLGVELQLTELKPGWVYSIRGIGVRSSRGEPLVHPTGVYTLNEVPR